MPGTTGGPFLDGIGVNFLLEWVKDYIDNNGGTTLVLPAPSLTLDYAATGDYATVTVTSDYSSFTENGGVVTFGYTTDGTAPTIESPAFSSPMAIAQNCTLTVRAFYAATAENVISSAPSAIVISGLKCQAPVLSYDEGSKVLTMTCGTSGATIRYTTDGSEPTEASAAYSSPITVAASATYKAKAFLAGIDASDTATKDVTVIVITANVFAVQWNYGDPSTALTRLTPETDPLGIVTRTVSTEPSPATSASSSGSSPFDSYGPWNGMKRRNFDSSGNPSYWDGESGFSTTSYDTMVWIPEFYIKVVDDPSNSKRTYYLSDEALGDYGFTLHPGSGQYVGAYPTSYNNESKSGFGRNRSVNIGSMRMGAKEKGTGWGLIDIAERSAIQYLYLIEFADWNSETKIGEGPASDLTTGQSDTMVYHTGKGTNDVVRYRYIEGLWRSQNEWTDGFNTVSGSHYVSTARDSYDSGITEGYTLVGSGSFSGYMTKLLYKSDMPWLIGMPEPGSSTGSESTYVSDKGALEASGTYALQCGGYWGAGSNAGMFYFGKELPASRPSSDMGSRLSYKAS